MADTISVGDWAKVKSPGNALSPLPVHMAAAATIAPSTYLTVLSGTTAVVTITIPYTGFSGTLCIVWTDGSPGATTTAGNIALATTVVQYKAVLFTYDPVNAKWYPNM